MIFFNFFKKSRFLTIPNKNNSSNRQRFILQFKVFLKVLFLQKLETIIICSRDITECYDINAVQLSHFMQKCDKFGICCNEIGNGKRFETRTSFMKHKNHLLFQLTRKSAQKIGVYVTVHAAHSDSLIFSSFIWK